MATAHFLLEELEQLVLNRSLKACVPRIRISLWPSCQVAIIPHVWVYLITKQDGNIMNDHILL